MVHISRLTSYNAANALWHYDYDYSIAPPAVFKHEQQLDLPEQEHVAPEQPVDPFELQEDVYAGVFSYLRNLLAGQSFLRGTKDERAFEAALQAQAKTQGQDDAPTIEMAMPDFDGEIVQQTQAALLMDQKTDQVVRVDDAPGARAVEAVQESAQPLPGQVKQSGTQSSTEAEYARGGRLSASNEIVEGLNLVGSAVTVAATTMVQAKALEATQQLAKGIPGAANVTATQHVTTVGFSMTGQVREIDERPGEPRAQKRQPAKQDDAHKAAEHQGKIKA